MPKEIVFTGKQQFNLLDYDDSALAADEIRGETLCSLISQGTEMGWADGDDFPIRPGYAAVFRVDEVGKDVKGVKPGDLRFCMGPHRQTQQSPVQFTLPVPDNLAPHMAVLARLVGVSMTTLMTTKARPGDRVIICGAGPVGFLAAHLFSLTAYDVLVVEPDELRRSQLEASGIKQLRTTMPLDDPQIANQVALVVDCSGHEAAVLAGCQVVRQMGEVVMVGVPWRKLSDIDAHELLKAVFFNLVTLRSGWEWEIPILPRAFAWEELLEGYNNAPQTIFSGFERSLNWLADARFPVEPLIKSVTPYDPVSLYGDIRERRIEQPFIVLDWADNDAITGV